MFALQGALNVKISSLSFDSFPIPWLEKRTNYKILAYIDNMPLCFVSSEKTAVTLRETQKLYSFKPPSLVWRRRKIRWTGREKTPVALNEFGGEQDILVKGSRVLNIRLDVLPNRLMCEKVLHSEVIKNHSQ